MHENFIARQPVFDKLLRVYGYELLFRGGAENVFQVPSNAAATVIADSITLFDLRALVGDARAFINADELALRLGAVRLLPPDRVVVEILETVKPTEEIVGICRDLRTAGYQLALDDFTDAPELAPLAELAHFLKIDFTLMKDEARAQIARKYANRNGISLLAEKVETRQEFQAAQQLGFSYFQGYFFCKPSMLEARQIPGNKTVQLQLLSAVSGPEIDCNEIEQLLKHDPSMLYRLLRYLNSPLLGVSSEVHTVKQALVMAGEREFRRWVSIFAMIAMSSGKPPELIRTGLTRAYFCEDFSTAAQIPERAPDLFFMGLLSVVDALLDKPLEEVLLAVPIAADVRSALAGGENKLRLVYDTVLALEQAEWPRLGEVVGKLGCPEELVPDVYRVAREKAEKVGV